MILGKIIIFLSIAVVTSVIVAIVTTKLGRWINKERIETELDNLEYEELKNRIRKGD